MPDIEKAINCIRDTAKDYARAKATRIYLHEFRKSKKAILYQRSPSGTIAEKESYAYGHPEYLEVLDGLRCAVEEEERLRFILKAAELRFEAWRTDQATLRTEKNRYGA